MLGLASLTFVTTNAAKVRSLQKYASLPITYKIHHLEEIQSLDIKEVLLHKAQEAYEIVKKPVLVDDSSLTFNALGKLPGPFIKWFETLGNEALCRLLDPYNDRSAMYSVGLALYDGKDVTMFIESAYGTIASHPSGKNGFGWNAIFIYQGLGKTVAELTEEEKERYSTRKRAIEKLEKQFFCKVEKK